MFCRRCGRKFFNQEIFCCRCGIRRKTNAVASNTIFPCQKDAIEHYFKKGLRYESIVMFLDMYHDIKISLRTLKRRLSEYGFKKRDPEVSEASVRHILET